VVYVVGGLYGNPFALSRLAQLFDAEPATRKLFVLNGDFHWFDRDEASFAHIERATAPFVRLRGNVETEIAAPGDDAGCGCAYPASVPDEDVDRSNVILGELKQVARAMGCDQALGALPAVARVSCGGLHMAITHGDDRSLAGWADTCDEDPLYRAAVGGADVAAVPVRFDASAWQAYFLQRWPEGSAAHTSYWRRIQGGPAHHPDRAARGLFQRHV
jgi:hypothetical protein